MERQLILLLGGNQGNSLDYIAQSLWQIEEKIGKILQKSPLVESEPWGFAHSQNFINLVVRCESLLNPKEILSKIHEIEQNLGRVRHSQVYQARTIDIDILFFGQTIINEVDLQIPHPRLHLRKFTLLPLCALDCNFFHPILNKNIQTLLSECDDMAFVRILD